jgi:hypothetical protein
MEGPFIKAIDLQMNTLNNMEHSWIIQHFGNLLFENQLYEKIIKNFVLEKPTYNPIIGSILEIAKHHPEKYNEIVNKMFANSLNHLSK